MILKKSIAISLILIIIGVVIFAFIQGGYYPVAVVNFHLINAKTFNKYYSNALNYFQNAFTGNKEKLKEAAVMKEIKRAALNKLIEDYLIYKEAKEKAGRDLKPIAEKKIAAILDLKDKEQFENAVKKLYGFNLEDFKNAVLFPQAYKEILEGRMNLNNENYDEWLAKAKKKAVVLILLSGFRWDGVELKLAS